MEVLKTAILQYLSAKYTSSELNGEQNHWIHTAMRSVMGKKIKTGGIWILMD